MALATPYQTLAIGRVQSNLVVWQDGSFGMAHTPGTGVYTFTLDQGASLDNRPGTALFAALQGATGNFISITQTSNTTFEVRTFNGVTASPEDHDFSFEIRLAPTTNN